jgi:hypothetical protein
VWCAGSSGGRGSADARRGDHTPDRPAMDSISFER